MDGLTLRSLLARGDLHLRLVSAPAELDPGATAHRIRWVHSSDLEDPTPFLTEDCVLMTTGTQFADAGPADADAYVRRLAARGVLALGFGTEVVRAGVPDALVDACRAARMPLFEVPYRTPFIAVARAAADAIAAEAYARRSWALAAQRAIAIAALRPEGLAATLAELSRQLGAWVAQYDAGGDLVRQFPSELEGPAATALAAEVRAVLGHGGQASSSLRVAARPFLLQTVGGARPLGVIAIGAGSLDQEARGVVTAVVAMAGLALEQSRGIRRADAALRGGIMQALVGGAESVAEGLARERGGALPPEPVEVVLLDLDRARRDAVVDWLEARAAHTRDASFWGPGPEGILVLVGSEDAELPRDLVEAFELAAGVSEPASYAEISRARREAATALDRGAGGVSRFADVAASGLLSALDSGAARALAHAYVEPLRRHDESHGTALLPTVRAWLEHDARTDTTALALGVHRHTVRARIAHAERVLGLDLSTFPARAELWAALQLDAT
ncbi:PucR family transcriptional regulator ligand-binding domain-containing protein [Microbacterium sp. X-17]|uniref:PucR family transcriptional regulator n=1 Tax=Microbacterium sp. X-17 TaxID=3144404 RepID=UPI0031F56E69